MNGLLQLLLIVIAYCWALWILYKSTMASKRLIDNGDFVGVSRSIVVLTYIEAFVAIVVDVLGNLTIATVIFGEWPKLLRWRGGGWPMLAWQGWRALPIEWPGKWDPEWTVTGRVTRWKYSAGDSRRKKIATWICRNLLDLYQQGGHCNQ